MYSQHLKLAKEFESATPKGKKLPYHVKKKARHHKAVMKGLSGY
jgi:hypothetical protein